MAQALSRNAAGDLARPRVPRQRHHAHPAPARGPGEAVHRQLHRFRTPARRTPAPAADRARKEQAERAHLQKFIDRFKAKASKAKQAQSRMKRLAKLAGTEAVRAERALHIDFPEPLRLPTSLLSLHDVDAGYPAVVGGASAPIGIDRNIAAVASDSLAAVQPAPQSSSAASTSGSRPATASACSAPTARASRRW